jgi:hypothetical protein
MESIGKGEKAEQVVKTHPETRGHTINHSQQFVYLGKKVVDLVTRNGRPVKGKPIDGVPTYKVRYDLGWTYKDLTVPVIDPKTGKQVESPDDPKQPDGPKHPEFRKVSVPDKWNGYAEREVPKSMLSKERPGQGQGGQFREGQKVYYDEELFQVVEVPGDDADDTLYTIEDEFGHSYRVPASELSRRPAKAKKKVDGPEETETYHPGQVVSMNDKLYVVVSDDGSVMITVKPYKSRNKTDAKTRQVERSRVDPVDDDELPKEGTQQKRPTPQAQKPAAEPKHEPGPAHKGDIATVYKNGDAVSDLEIVESYYITDGGAKQLFVTFRHEGQVYGPEEVDKLLVTKRAGGTKPVVPPKPPVTTPAVTNPAPKPSAAPGSPAFDAKHFFMEDGHLYTYFMGKWKVKVLNAAGELVSVEQNGKQKFVELLKCFPTSNA